MVGVAGKSKACHDCRRRRVKCDLKRPTCIRCEKAKIKCQGYSKDAPIFINRTFENPRTTANTVIAKRKTEALPLTTPTDPLFFSKWHQTLEMLITVGFPTSLLSERIQFRNEAWHLLKNLYLPRAVAERDVDLERTTAYSWLAATCSLEGSSDALDYSLAALCAIQVDVTDAVRHPGKNAGLQLYNRALPKLVEGLRRKPEEIECETLASIVVLSTCELFVLSSDEGWTAHANGISEILRGRDPKVTSKSRIWQSLCTRLRIVCVLLGLTRRRSLSLGATQWCGIISQERTVCSIETIMDIITQVPQLMEESETLLLAAGNVTNFTAFNHRVSKLDEELLDIGSKLHAWQQAFQQSLGRPAYWVVPATANNPSDDDYPELLFPFALEFESLDIAMPILLSSGVILQILGVLIQLIRLPDQAQQSSASIARTSSSDRAFNTVQTSSFDDLLGKLFSSSNPLPSASSVKIAADELARFICQAVQYCHKTELGTLGPQSTCHAQWSLRRYFRQNGLTRELDWCKNIKHMTGPDFRGGLDLLLMRDDDIIFPTITVQTT